MSLGETFRPGRAYLEKEERLGQASVIVAFKPQDSMELRRGQQLARVALAEWSEREANEDLA